MGCLRPQLFINGAAKRKNYPTSSARCTYPGPALYLKLKSSGIEDEHASMPDISYARDAHQWHLHICHLDLQQPPVSLNFCFCEVLQP